MNISLLKRGRELFVRDYIPRHVHRSNLRAWVRSVRNLGDRWLLAQPINSPNRSAKGEHQ